jgi:CrcB protein
MLNVLAIFIGGGLGSLSRYGISRLVTSNFTNINPVATFTSNIISTIILGVILFFASERVSMPEHIRALVIVGFCGGFSTFSTFSYETFELFRQGNVIFAFANILISVFLIVGVLFVLAKNI